MQKWIFSKKNCISLISLILIASAYISELVFKNLVLANWALIVAGAIGVLPIALQAFQSLKLKIVSIDVLVTIAVFGAFLIQNYAEAAIVTFLFLFGAFLEQRTLNKTRSAIKELTQMAPETALKQQEDGSFEEVDIHLVNVGDILLVKTGSKVPVDGKVLQGEGYVNEASITGESVFVDKEVGSSVFAGTILDNGTLQIKAEKVGEDTTFGKIIELVEEAQDAKSATERFIDKFSKYYTPIVFVLGVLVGIIWNDLALAITIFVLGCPGALVIGVPISNVAGIGSGARHGVLLKGSEVIHDFSKVDSIVFDKTGTLTTGTPKVSETKFYTLNQQTALDYLYAIESESDHPLAKAIVNHIQKQTTYEVQNTEVVKRGGVVAIVNNQRVAVGNLALMQKEQIEMNKDIQEDIHQLEKDGNSIVITAVNQKVEIVMGVKDQVRPEVKESLAKLKKLGVKNLIVLSGDNQPTVDLVASQLGFTKAYGNMLPEDKSACISQMQKEGHVVAFVGDGINDSPSLATANIGIAMGGGTDVAIETSDVVLMHSDLKKLIHALALTKAIARNMKQNIMIAVGVVLILLSSVLLSEWMNMSIGMLIHEASILLVILNGMRLLRYRYKK